MSRTHSRDHGSYLAPAKPDKIASQKDQRVFRPGDHIEPGSEAAPKQRCPDDHDRGEGEGGGLEQTVKKEAWIKKRPF